MSQKIHGLAKNIFEDKDQIVEKYIFFDEDREGFIFNSSLDIKDVPLLIVYLLQMFSVHQKAKDNIVTFDKDERNKNIQGKIKKAIESCGIFGVSFKVLVNKLKSLTDDNILINIDKMIEEKVIFQTMSNPVRGKPTMKYFLNT